MRLAIISFTVRGSRLCALLAEKLRQAGWSCTGYVKCRFTEEIPSGLTVVEETLAEWTARAFSEEDALLFIGAAGIAVRAVAPYLRDKLTDPAVAVADEGGQFVISLLSGHMGGGNELAREAASCLGATAVVTTATDVNHIQAVDVFARKNGLLLGERRLAKEISADMLQGVPVGMFSDYPIVQDASGGREEWRFQENRVCARNVWISRSIQPRPDSAASVLTREGKPVLRLVPRALHIGIGSRKGISAGQVLEAIKNVLAENNCVPEAAADLSSIDLKADEEGIREAAKELGLPYRTWTAEELAAVGGEFTESEFVRSVTGVGNVCERAAMRAAGEGAVLIVRKTVYGGVTAAVAEERVVLRR